MSTSTRTLLAPDWRVATPPQLAMLLGVSPTKILGWIVSGDLVGRNVARSIATRPVYRVDRADFDEFWRVRASGPLPTKPAKLRRAPQSAVKSFV